MIKVYMQIYTTLYQNSDIKLNLCLLITIKEYGRKVEILLLNGLKILTKNKIYDIEYDYA